MTIDEFKTLYPDLTQSFVDEQIGFQLKLANVLIDKISSFGDMREHALTLLLAHMLTLDKKSGSSGKALQTATSKKVGEVQYSYSAETGDRAWYNLSGYGQQLLVLIDMQPKYGGAFVV